MSGERQERDLMRTADASDYPGRRQSRERIIPGHRPITRARERVSEQPGNSARTRKARLSAVRSFFRYGALRHPEHAALIARVLDIPAKRCQHTEVRHLDQPEVDALLAAPDRQTWTGRRDHALLDVAVQTGLRLSELTSLRICDVHLAAGAPVRCPGNGRNDS